jgi:hypothetical protein
MLGISFLGDKYKNVSLQSFYKNLDDEVPAYFRASLIADHVS